jgi:hypothetical protein
VAAATVEPVADPSQDFEERAAISDYDDGLPRDIAEGLAWLETIPPPNGFTPDRWQEVKKGTALFADKWGARALELGWLPIELFGMHPSGPAARHNCRGLAFMLDHGEVVDMNAIKATVIQRSGAKQSYYRCRPDPEAKLAWVPESDPLGKPAIVGMASLDPQATRQMLMKNALPIWNTMPGCLAHGPSHSPDCSVPARLASLIRFGGRGL